MRLYTRGYAKRYKPFLSFQSLEPQLGQTLSSLTLAWDKMNTDFYLLCPGEIQFRPVTDSTNATGTLDCNCTC